MSQDLLFLDDEDIVDLPSSVEWLSISQPLSDLVVDQKIPPGVWFLSSGINLGKEVHISIVQFQRFWVEKEEGGFKTISRFLPDSIPVIRNGMQMYTRDGKEIEEEWAYVLRIYTENGGISACMSSRPSMFKVLKKLHQGIKDKTAGKLCGGIWRLMCGQQQNKTGKSYFTLTDCSFVRYIEKEEYLEAKQNAPGSVFSLSSSETSAVKQITSGGKELI